MPEDEKKKQRIRPVVEVVEESNEPQIEASEEQSQPVVESNKEELQKKVEEVVGERKRGISFKLLFFLTILTALVVGFVTGGVYVYWTGIRSVSEPSSSAEPIVVSTPEPTATLESTPEAEVDLSKLKVSVLNGSGKIGEAGKVEKLIDAAGFSVSNTGNAKTFDFEETLVEFKKEIPENVISKLSDTLSGTYVVSVSNKNLSDTSSYDIVITVGSKGR